MTTTLKEASERIPTQREKILNLLRNAADKGITNQQFQNVCIRWDARVRELYQQGYVIENESLGNGVYKYILVSEPETIADKPKKAIELLISKINNTYNGKIDTESLSSLLEAEGLQVVRKHGAHKITK
ncbi:hypothetical protein CHH83_01820 [Bacillus sp. 7586-K]|nr:hypothetical protein CHH83_01820 [Bacillus sp. 7586-K]